MNISKIREDIAEAASFISRDEETIAELQIALDDIGDVEAEILHWRVTAARARKPVDVVPLRLSQKRIEVDALRQTIEATTAVIDEQRERIVGLEAELEAALASGHAASWDRVCEEAGAVCVDLEAARVAYLAASKKLYALHQSAKPGEFFPPDVNTHYAPDFAHTLRRPYDLATGFDMPAWKRELSPIREKAIAWRNTLAENPEAPSPFLIVV